MTHKEVMDIRLVNTANLMEAYIRKAKQMEVGKQYILYEYLNNDRTAAVELRRTLKEKHPYIAVFTSKSGRTHAYSYTQLAEMIQKPDSDCVIKTEKQRNRELIFGKE